jgi:hypothetical protein
MAVRWFLWPDIARTASTLKHLARDRHESYDASECNGSARRPDSSRARLKRRRNARVHRGAEEAAEDEVARLEEGRDVGEHRVRAARYSRPSRTTTIWRTSGSSRSARPWRGQLAKDEAAPDEEALVSEVYVVPLEAEELAAAQTAEASSEDDGGVAQVFECAR